ncbi:ABC transporter ATP-binding protein [Coralliovum pocilloporae]|uniref:ABC transporter ATP-binding protein n=1 Tax=Coralliovum pocilloporae TaxID=3066369 RepID=UPI0033079F72
MTLLSVRDLAIDFLSDEGRVCAVNGISFDVHRKRTVALVGESGSGKTVVSKAIMGLLPDKAQITRGQMLFADPATPGDVTDLTKLPQDSDHYRALRGNRIGIIFQEPMTSLSPLHTIGDQVSEAARLHRGMGRKEALALTAEILRLVRFPNPDRALSMYPFELSGGLRQRAMIAMALICRPALLIADEPTTALDVTIQAEILKLIRELQDELDMSVLMITHDFGVVANVADDVVVIYHGEIMESGPVDTIFRDPQHDYLKALLNAVPRFDMGDSERLIPIRPVKPNTDGSLFVEAEKRVLSAAGTPLLKLENVCKTFRQRNSGWFGGGEDNVTKALDMINLTVRRGECLGVVGESGSGKTTAAKAMLRAIELDSGTIHYHGGETERNILDLEGEALLDYRKQVQLIFQDPFSSLNPRMTIYEILSEPFVVHNIGTEKERNERIKELMSLVGLDPRFLRRYPHSFSGGQRQRIGIARALALLPELILCDEPVSALDVSVQAQILNLLKDLQSKLGLTYVFVSHNLAVVDYIADRIAVMCRGRLVEVGPSAAIVNNPQHPYTKALLSAVPEADLDNPLDFDALKAGGGSEPDEWPDPYRLDNDTVPNLVQVGDDHFVCAPGASADSYNGKAA